MVHGSLEMACFYHFSSGKYPKSYGIASRTSFSGVLGGYKGALPVFLHKLPSLNFDRISHKEVTRGSAPPTVQFKKKRIDDA